MMLRAIETVREEFMVIAVCCFLMTVFVLSPAD